MPSSTRWRLRIHTSNGGGFANTVELAELYFLLADGSRADHSGISSSIAHTWGEAVSNLYDGNSATYCGGAINYASGNYYIEYQFPSAVSIEGVELRARISSPNYSPNDFDIEYYNGSAFVAYVSPRDQYHWDSGELRKMTKGLTRIWRIYVTVVIDGGQDVALAEAQFRTTIGNAESHTSNFPFASGRYDASTKAANGFDGDGNTAWGTPDSPPQWIEYWFQSQKAVAQLFIKAGPSSIDATRAPNAFDLQYSDDLGASYTTVMSRSGIDWTGGQERVFNVETGGRRRALIAY